MESVSVSSHGEIGGTGGHIIDSSVFESASSSNSQNSVFCDACPMCLDVCESNSMHNLLHREHVPVACERCLSKRDSFISVSKSCKLAYTMCEVRRHNRREDCWLVAHNRVYDATSFIDSHPAGPSPILLRAGKDVTVDFDFHSAMSQKTFWKPLLIGRVVQCPLRERSSGPSLFFPESSCTIQ